MTTDVKKLVRFCDSKYGKEIVKREAEYIYEELRNCEEILDIGCGIGQFEQILSHLNIIGLDISKEMLQEARERCDKTFIQGNAEHLKFEDYIYCSFYGDHSRVSWRLQKGIKRDCKSYKPSL